ncbi:hypothetical protein NOF04DRAFT_3413 [Fusarium oxysporum II5]|uniref:Uncharacterized protein n=1 Tax=Fusarium odoratissimum (strain NRRL 54006) TaxID=1089451 RepID=X0J148_FUSO5|nr:uncharacterized protein FOIG_16632 [Fusarium odoratissimum NRRL 54006]EXL90096.1 hypothetical protein FOIG_16632 [Fusarium odoratissimum NRRL 54006]KAK2134142.1 hypothetical protein NOF04DRAFT_3413 [Fusarium oxysporum II5]
MKVALVISIFIASCIASPLDPAKTPTSPPGAEHTLNYVDITPTGPEFGNVNGSSALISRDTLPHTACPAGQTYDRSVCYNSHTIRSFCVANPRSNREQITDTPCNSGEVCVQRRLSSGKSYAKCLPVRDLVSWRTDPDGDKEGCTTVEANPIGYHSLATMIYDINNNPIQVDKIRYLGEPGDANEGIGGSVSNFSSDRFRFTGSNYMKGSNLVKRSRLTESVCVHAGAATGANLHWLSAICTGKSTYTVNCVPAGNKNAGSTHTGTCPAGQDCFQLEQVGNFWGDREPDVTCSSSNTVFDATDDKEATHVNGKVVTRAGKPEIGPRLIRLKAQVYDRDRHYGQTSRMGFFRNGVEVYGINDVASMGPTWNFDPSSDRSFSFFFTPGPNAFRIQGTVNLA